MDDDIDYRMFLKRGCICIFISVSVGWEMPYGKNSSAKQQRVKIDVNKKQLNFLNGTIILVPYQGLGNYNYPSHVIAVFPCFDLGYVLIAFLCFYMNLLSLNFTVLTVSSYSNQVKNKINAICNYNIKNKHWFCNLPIFQVGSISWPT